MTGERQRAGSQPGGRPPAPGSLALVQSFINTHFDLERDHGAEVLSSPAALGGWLTRAGLLERRAPVRERDLVRALTLRETLRTLAGASPGTSSHTRVARATRATRATRVARATRERLDSFATGARIEVRFGLDRPRFIAAPGTGVDGAFGALLAIVAQSIADGSFSRLKICPGRHCGWAFYDHSRNRSGRWCSMSVCGGREKARSHYRRNRDEEED